MTHQNNGGAQGSTHLEIIRLRRISQSQPTAWEGTTTQNDRVHIAYRYGVLSLNLWLPAPALGANWGTWQDILRIKPLEIMAEIQLARETPRATERSLALRRQQLRVELDNRILSEIRSDVWRRKDRPARIVTVRELWEWMEARERHYEMLHHRGLAGGMARVKISALTDGVA